MSQPTSVHPRLFSIEGIPASSRTDQIPAILAAKTFLTLRNKLVRDPDNIFRTGRNWMPFPAQTIRNAELLASVANLVCTIPGSDANQGKPTAWRLPPLKCAGKIVETIRTDPKDIAKFCVDGLWNVLGGTSFLDTQGRCSSGPEPIAMGDLKEYIEALPQLSMDTPAPTAAPDFASDMCLVATRIFERVTGSPELPSVTCEVTYRPAQTLLT